MLKLEKTHNPTPILSLKAIRRLQEDRRGKETRVRSSGDGRGDGYGYGEFIIVLGTHKVVRI